MIIISGHLARECEVKEVISLEGKPCIVLNNCVFVKNVKQGKVVQVVPMNIIAWGENAKFIKENFMKGSGIQLVAQETPHERKDGEQETTECIFTVKRILDWDMYINTVKFLGNTLSLLENRFTDKRQDPQTLYETTINSVGLSMY